ncbi:MAG: uracil-DNA glycosylase family protein [Planctomycetota bacterium]
MKLPVLLDQARACRVCEEHLPEGPRPLLQGSTKARLLIIGQAPGFAAHTTGIPWDDQSGQRLRDWLGFTDEQFYNPDLVALLPMGLCYPGKARSGDAPPRPECAPLWHPQLLEAWRHVGLTVYIGKYAHNRYLREQFKTITDAVRGYGALLPERIALPHPSPRNNIWLKKNSWYANRVLPKLKHRIRAVVR